MIPIGPSRRNTWRVSADAAELMRPALQERRVDVAARPKRVAFDLARTAFIVIDMQNDFCHRDGWLASIGVDVEPARAPIAPLTALLPVLRGAGVPVVWVNWGSRPDRLNLSPALLHVYNGSGTGTGLGDALPATGSPVLQGGSWSAQVVDELAPDPRDIRVDKHRMSGFWDTPLDSILRNLRIETLLFAGVNLDQCVLHTLADANFAGFDTLLVEDCAATTNPRFCHDATILNIHQIFGFTLQSPDLAKAIAP
ncbi:cysteine hydrolase family protein [Roseomonas fluvialis]|uniref:Peroxyureidoacrylate/ureidoacrylate amidohydrolase RutB n=1 Tax=Roseomonas fluvialis TaxID=1750527 RepID=A0ABN6P8E6_9PROT|nr:isochorismatase family cysteine hydrolase [Roseomonas fluvialis]BDG75182.1 peroxyureidoacrylate/ureidoacrylate amidohydrolase RutB [Roseomonas fluvialis]